MKLLCSLCLLVIVVAQHEQQREQRKQELKSCAQNYADGRNLTSNCEIVIENFEKNLNERVIGSAVGDIAKCIEDKMKEYQYLDFFLHMEVDKAREHPVFESVSYGGHIIDAPGRICSQSYFTDKNVEERLQRIKSHEEDGHRNFQCAYLYSIDRKTIDMTNFVFDTSHFKPNNCTEIFETLDNGIEEPTRPEALAWKYAQCIDHKKQELRIEKTEFLINSIGIFDLSDKQKEKLKTMYANFYSSIDQSIMDCVRKTYKKINDV